MTMWFITNLTRQAGMMEKARAQLALIPGFPAAHVMMIDHRSLWNEAWEENLALAAVTVISWMGDPADNRWVQNSVAFLQRRKRPYMLLGQFDGTIPGAGGTIEADVKTVSQYLLCSGQCNYSNLWRWLAARYCDYDNECSEPIELPWCGIVHPQDGRRIHSLESYRQAGFLDPGKPTAGMLIPRDEWVWGDLLHQQALIAALRRQGLNVIPVFSHWAADPVQNSTGVDTAVATYFRDETGWVIDVLINTMKFSLTVGRPVDIGFLQTIDRPILQAYNLLQAEAAWRESFEGLSPLDVSFSLALPEFDGVIHSVPFACKEGEQLDELHRRPISDRLDLLARKAKKWALLRRIPNSEKKIAIVFHNYPPTNASVGNAAGLDSAASVWRLLEQMSRDGYQVDHLPTDAQDLMNRLIESGTNDRQFIGEEQLANYCGQVSAAQYRDWFDRLPEKPAMQLRQDWGEPPGEVFRLNDRLMIGGMRLGNVYIGVQPPRGFSEDPGKLYHSPDCAPTHHYLAYYDWVREIFGADAVIHMGTHGSLEWLPGKAAGLSGECYPELALGDLPDIYPYLITIVGEGVQAKRRGAACLIGHQTPPMSHAGVYEGLAEVERLVDEYRDYRINQPEKQGYAAEQIRKAASQANLDKEVAPATEEESFESYLERLHAYINDIKNMQVRVGLHILGQAPTGETLIEYLLAMTRFSNGTIPSLFSTVAALKGYDYDELQDKRGELVAGSRRTYGDVLDEVRSDCRRVIKMMQDADFNITAFWAEMLQELTWRKDYRDEGFARLRKVTEFICGPLKANLDLTTQEMRNTLRALDGKYIEPGAAGAPTSGMADILPTGRNFYGVDPRTLPSPVAWECGKTLASLVIERFVAEEGHYPENIGVVLWSGANMRSRGQCIAQFFYLLGVRPIWQKSSGRVLNLEVIPLTELKRPRIDVTARISGLFRDAMPFAVALMDRAVKQVAELNEPWDQNFVRKHVEQDAYEMEKAGMDARKCREQASFRIFGCPPGSYGAGVGALLEAKNWESIDDLAKVYVKWGGYAYGMKAKGEYAPERFSSRLSKLDITIKNEDNREVNMLHSDDFNAYHGGMIAAVSSLRGTAPRSYCGDSSDRGRITVRSLQEEFKRIFRGEAMNPKYMEGMKKHGYKGAADLAAVAAHCFDWDATSSVMEGWMYETLAEKYALDADMQAWMKEVNPWALRRIAEKLLEAQQRGMWEARSETLDELRKLYLDIEGEVEDRSEIGIRK